MLRTIRLSDPGQTELCLETLELMAREEMGDTELDLLWKSQFVDRRVKATLEDLLEDESGALARLVRKHSSDLSLGDVRESLRRAQIQVHFPMVTPPAATTPRPDASSLVSIDDQATTGAAPKTGKTPVSYALAYRI